MFEDFNAILVEGLFYEKDGAIYIEKDGGTHVSFADVVAPCVGHNVQFALHHLPPNGVEPDLPGAGSCKYPNGQGCPAHHDRFPDRLLSFHLEGVLQSDPWRVDKFDGTSVRVPLAAMPGHFGRIGVATILDVEKMRESLGNLTPEGLAVIGIDTKNLEQLLERLKEASGKG